MQEAASTLPDVNSTWRPSAVKPEGRSSAELEVRRLAGLPPAGMRKTSKLPWRSDAKASEEPSGDHTGWKSYASWVVSGTARPPAAGTRYRSPR